MSGVAGGTLHVALLRGINVGKAKRIAMADLRGLLTRLGCTDVQSVLQSGNVVFRTDARDFTRLSKRIADALEQRFAFRPGVILRTAADLRSVIAANPFASRRELDPRRLLVQFLASEPPAEETTGVPQAMASRMGRPKPSPGRASMAAYRYRSS